MNDTKQSRFRRFMSWLSLKAALCLVFLLRLLPPYNDPDDDPGYPDP